MKFDDLKNRTVLISGGATGIGAALVTAFAAQKCFVCFSDVNESAGEALAKSLGDIVSFVCADMSESEDIKRWVDSGGSRSGKVDVLVNNVGLDTRVAFEDADIDAIQRQFELNYFSAVRACHAALAYLKKGEAPSIINFGSATFNLGYPNLSGYMPAKSAILGLTRGLARELGKDGIRVNTLSPGWVMTEKQLDAHVTPESTKELLEDQCLPQLIQPADIAMVALFLASEVSSAIVGQNIVADRGWTHS